MKKNTFSKIILGICFMLLSTSIMAQTYKYQISNKKDILGKLVVHKTTNDSNMQIEVISDIYVDLLSGIDFKYKYNSTFEDNKLIFSSITTYVNGEVHSTSITEFNNGVYNISKNGHKYQFIESIDYTSALLYTKEPKDISSIYADFENINKQILDEENHCYEVVNDKKTFASYCYSDGILDSATINQKLMRIYLKRIKVQ